MTREQTVGFSDEVRLGLIGQTRRVWAPVGVQVVGARYREDLALDAAEVIERAVGVLTPIDPVVA